MESKALRQVWAIASGEIDFLAHHRVLHAFIAALILALLVALLVGWQDHLARSEQQVNLQALVKQQWINQPDRHPHRAAHYGSFAFRQPSPLGFFDHGVDSYVGNAIYLEAHRQNPANFSASRHATTLLRFGELTPAFLLQTILPLLLLIMAGSSIVREREQKTLLLLYAQGITSKVLVFGKAFAYLTFGTTAVLLTIGASLAMAWLAGKEIGPEDAWRAALLALAYLLLMAICSIGATYVSSVCRSSRQALLIVTGLWLLMFIMTPRILPYWTHWAHPTPSRLAFEAAVHTDLLHGGDGHNPADPDFTRFRKEVLIRYGVDKKEDLPVNIRGLIMEESERRSSVVFERHYAKLQAQFARQEALQHRMIFFNPALSIRHLSATLTGTDRAAFVDFERQAEAYRYEFIQQLNHLHTHYIREENDPTQRVDSNHWHDIEQFKHEPPALRVALAATVSSLTALVVWFVGLLLWIVARRGDSA